MNTKSLSVKLKTGASPITKSIFNFVIENDYDVFTSSYDMQRDILDKSFYKKYIKDSKDVFLRELKKMNFYDAQLFENSREDEGLKEIQKTLYNFQLAIISILMQNGKIPKGKGSVTSANPPLTVKIGNNKLDIKPTGRDYGLLFR